MVLTLLKVKLVSPFPIIFPNQYETNQYVLGKVPFILYFGVPKIEAKRSDGFARLFGIISFSVLTIASYVFYFF